MIIVENLFNGEMKDDLVILIDVSNIVFGAGKEPILKNFLILRDYLIEFLGVKDSNIVAICDPNLEYKIDDIYLFKILLDTGVIIKSPKVADEFLLAYGVQKNGYIITNDKFREYTSEIGNIWIQEHTIQFMIIRNEIVLSPGIAFDNFRSSLKEADKESDVREAGIA